MPQWNNNQTMPNGVCNSEYNSVTVLRDVMLCNLVDTYRNFGGNYCLNYQNKFIHLHYEGCHLQVPGEPLMAVAYARLLRFPVLAKVHM